MAPCVGAADALVSLRHQVISNRGIDYETFHEVGFWLPMQSQSSELM